MLEEAAKAGDAESIRALDRLAPITLANFREQKAVGAIGRNQPQSRALLAER